MSLNGTLPTVVEGVLGELIVPCLLILVGKVLSEASERVVRHVKGWLE